MQKMYVSVYQFTYWFIMIFMNFFSSIPGIHYFLSICLIRRENDRKEILFKRTFLVIQFMKENFLLGTNNKAHLIPLLMFSLSVISLTMQLRWQAIVRSTSIPRQQFVSLISQFQTNTSLIVGLKGSWSLRLSWLSENHLSPDWVVIVGN